MKLVVAPLTPDRWPDLEAVFNAKGCSIAPREESAKLKRSPVMKVVDEQSVWSVICFVVPNAGFKEVARRKPHRPIVRFKVG
jgi:hypothetical protein